MRVCVRVCVCACVHVGVRARVRVCVCARVRAGACRCFLFVFISLLAQRAAGSFTKLSERPAAQATCSLSFDVTKFPLRGIILVHSDDLGQLGPDRNPLADN